MGMTAASLAQFAMPLQAAGAASSAVGAYYAAANQRTLLDTQASIEEINARLAENAAQSTIEAGGRQEQASRLQTAKLKSSQRAALAANGVDIGTGSAAEAVASTDVLGEIDADTIHANAIRSAWGYRTQATSMRTDAMLRRGTADGINPVMSAATSLLGSAGTVAPSWYQFLKAGG